MAFLRDLKSLVRSLREAPARGRFDWHAYPFGYPARVSVMPRYGEGPRRSVALLGLENRSGHWSLMLQRYAEGCELAAHRDGGSTLSNEILWILLWKARAGGETFVEGPCRRWLGGRVMRFDGGRQVHGVTRVERGSRVSLILQRGRHGAAPAR